MLRKILLLAITSGAGPAYSQTSVPSATRQPWLVSLQAASYPALAQTPNVEGDNATGRPWPAQLLLRCPATHGSVEAGLLLRADPATTLSYADSYGTHTVRATGRTVCVPLVGRLRLLPRRAETWQLDATAGFMLVSSKYQREITYQDLNGSAPSTSSSTTMKYNDLPLIGGLGATYWLSPRLALTADARLTWSYLATLTVRLFVPDGRYVAPVQPAFSLGMGYAFGR